MSELSLCISTPRLVVAAIWKPQPQHMGKNHQNKIKGGELVLFCLRQFVSKLTSSILVWEFWWQGTHISSCCGWQRLDFIMLLTLLRNAARHCSWKDREASKFNYPMLSFIWNEIMSYIRSCESKGCISSFCWHRCTMPRQLSQSPNTPCWAPPCQCIQSLFGSMTGDTGHNFIFRIQWWPGFKVQR